MVRSLYERWIRASEKLEGSSERGRAELLSSLLIFRSVIFLSLLVYMPLAVVGSNKISNGILVGALGLNIVGYGISRTRYFRYGAILILLEALFAVPVSVMNIMTPDAISSGPIWLGLNNIIASLVLPFSWTVVSIFVTIIPFWIIATHVPSSYLTIVSGEFVYTMLSSTLALLGTYLRDKSDQTLQEERAKLQQISKLSALGEMAGGIAHELNTPLGAIVLNMDLMEEYIQDSPNAHHLRERVESVIDIAERMGKIINGLKVFSRDAQQDGFQSVPISKWVTDTLDLCQQRLRNRGIDFIVKEQNLQTVIDVQPVQMSQVLLNLLSNSFYAIQNQPEKWVIIESVTKQNWFEVQVTDSGRGIPRDVVDRLFQPFFTTKDVGQGTGLGLSISKGIMKSQGGDLIYDSSCPNTRFIIRLPLKKEEKSA